MSEFPDQIEMSSTELAKENLDNLIRIFPGILKDGMIDGDLISASTNLDIFVSESDKQRFGISWAGKNDAIKALQTISYAGLTHYETQNDDFDSSSNIFIEGDNLEVLKILQKAYNDQIKVIYIDPPYNTGNDYVYNDDFSDPRRHYLEVTGQLDSFGLRLSANSEISGRKHSNWLSMMYSRLMLARNLLTDDGVIFISIDDGEVANLRLLGNEVFGEENFVSTIIWQKKYAPANDARWFSDTHDFILVWARNKEKWRPQLLERTEEANARYTNRDNDSRGPWKSSDLSVRTYSAANDYPIKTPSGRIVNPPAGRSWRTSENKFKELLADNRVWFGEDGSNVPSIKRFLSEVKDGITPTTIWLHSEVGHNQEGVRDLQNLDIDGFTSPKPVRLIKNILKIAGLDEGDIVLDFFAGSGTTAQAVAEMNEEDGANRKFLLVNIDGPTPAGSPVQKLGFNKVSEITVARIKAVMKKYDHIRNSGVKFLKIAPSNFYIKDIDSDSDELMLFKRSLRDNVNEIDAAIEVFVKFGLRLDSPWQRNFISGIECVKCENVLLILSERITKDMLENILSHDGFRTVIFFEHAFENADDVKASAFFNLKAKNITMKTV